MSTVFIQRTLVAAAALVLVGGLFVTGSALQAQDGGGSAVVLGTYNPQQIAQASGFQEEMMAQMQGLQQEAQAAQQAGDQAKLQELQQKAQQMQQDATAQLISDMEAVMPQVAESEGVTAIVTQVTYSADGVTTKDVTQAIIDAMGAGSSDSQSE